MAAKRKTARGGKARKTTKKAPAKKAAAKGGRKAAGRKAAPRKAAAKRKSAARKPAGKRAKAPARKAPARKAPAKKAAPKKAAAPKAPKAPSAPKAAKAAKAPFAHRFVWHEVVTTDVAGAKAFYPPVLGFEAETYPMPPAGDYTMWKASGESLGGVMPAPAGSPPHWLPYVLVADCDASTAKVKELGGAVYAPPFDIPPGRMSVVADPQGAAFALIAEKEPRPERTGPAPLGHVAWDELTTSDVEGAKRFYAALLGWTARGQDMGPFGTYWILERGGLQMGGLTPQKPGESGPAYWLVYFHVRSADGVADTVRAQPGAKVLMAPDDIPTVGRIAIFADPAGAVFGVLQPAPM